METKIIKVNTRLITSNNEAQIIVVPDDFDGISIYTFLATSSYVSELHYFKWQPGDGLIVSSSKEDFYFDVNSNGELVAICPDDYDFSINSNGELLISKI